MFFLQASQRRLLSSFNPIFFALAVLLAILVRTTLWPVLPSVMVKWDVLLPFIVYFGQRRAMAEGLILSLFTSHLYSLSSAAPIGVFTSHYLVIFLLARALSFVIYANTWFSVLLLVFALTLVARFTLTLVAYSFGHGWHLFAPGNFSGFGILFNAIVGFLVFEMLALLDRFTYKSPRINIELAEGTL